MWLPSELPEAAAFRPTPSDPFGRRGGCGAYCACGSLLARLVYGVDRQLLAISGGYTCDDNGVYRITRGTRLRGARKRRPSASPSFGLRMLAQGIDADRGLLELPDNPQTAKPFTDERNLSDHIRRAGAYPAAGLDPLVVASPIRIRCETCFAVVEIDLDAAAS